MSSFDDILDNPRKASTSALVERPKSADPAANAWTSKLVGGFIVVLLVVITFFTYKYFSRRWSKSATSNKANASASEDEYEEEDKKASNSSQSNSGYPASASTSTTGASESKTAPDPFANARRTLANRQNRIAMKQKNQVSSSLPEDEQLENQVTSSKPSTNQPLQQMPIQSQAQPQAPMQTQGQTQGPDKNSMRLPLSVPQTSPFSLPDSAPAQTSLVLESMKRDQQSNFVATQIGQLQTHVQKLGDAVTETSRIVGDIAKQMTDSHRKLNFLRNIIQQQQQLQQQQQFVQQQQTQRLLSPRYAPEANFPPAEPIVPQFRDMYRDYAGAMAAKVPPPHSGQRRDRDRESPRSAR